MHVRIVCFFLCTHPEIRGSSNRRSENKIQFIELHGVWSKNVITHISIENLLKTMPPARLSDGGGLELRHQSTGDRWYLRFKHKGFLIQECLGTYPEVTLSQARQKAKEIRAGRQEDQSACMTVKAACEAWLAKKKEEIDPVTYKKIRCNIEKHLLAHFANRNFAEVSPVDLINAWEPVAKAHRYTIKRMCGYVRQIYVFCRNTGRVDFKHDLSNLNDNYAAHNAEHFPTIPPSELTALVRDLLKNGYRHTVAWQLLQLSLYTLLRQKEITSLRWEWIHDTYLEIPAEVMKQRRVHRVPITRQLKALLDSIPKCSVFVTPSPYYEEHPVCRETLNMAFRRCGYRDRLTAHGIRSIGSTWLAQQGVQMQVREACLAHVTGSAVELAYNRHDYLEERRKVMQEWADYVESCIRAASDYGTDREGQERL